jgi:hypothetical protein
MGNGDLVQGMLVVIFFPAHCQKVLFVPLKVGSLHCRPDQCPSCRVLDHAGSLVGGLLRRDR